MAEYINVVRKESFTPPRLKKFDLQEGDIVRCMNKYSERAGLFNSPEYNRWKVEKIYERTFLCRNPLGIATCYPKKDYQTGEVKRI